MPTDEMFSEAERSADDAAGVFEYDGETGYFYLCRLSETGSEVLSHIHILTGSPDFSEEDVCVRWDGSEERVGLLIRGVLWAVFDARSGAKEGGAYRPDEQPRLSQSLVRGFD